MCIDMTTDFITFSHNGEQNTLKICIEAIPYTPQTIITCFPLCLGIFFVLIRGNRIIFNSVLNLKLIFLLIL